MGTGIYNKPTLITWIYTSVTLPTLSGKLYHQGIKHIFFYSKRSNGWQLQGNGKVFFRKFVLWMAEFYGKVYPVKFK